MKHCVICLCALLLAGCTPKNAEQSTAPAEAAEAIPATREPVQPAAPATAAAPTVRMTTSMGIIVIELNAEKAPISE